MTTDLTFIDPAEATEDQLNESRRTLRKMIDTAIAVAGWSEESIESERRDELAEAGLQAALHFNDAELFMLGGLVTYMARQSHEAEQDIMAEADEFRAASGVEPTDDSAFKVAA